MSVPETPNTLLPEIMNTPPTAAEVIRDGRIPSAGIPSLAWRRWSVRRHETSRGARTAEGRVLASRGWRAGGGRIEHRRAHPRRDRARRGSGTAICRTTANRGAIRGAGAADTAGGRSPAAGGDYAAPPAAGLHGREEPGLPAGGAAAA